MRWVLAIAVLSILAHGLTGRAARTRLHQRKPHPFPYTSASKLLTEKGAAKKMLRFLLLVNKQGQTRLSQYYSHVPVEERVTTEADIVRKCLARNEELVR